MPATVVASIMGGSTRREGARWSLALPRERPRPSFMRAGTGTSEISTRNELLVHRTAAPTDPVAAEARAPHPGAET
jgi:hypothetical protein